MSVNGFVISYAVGEGAGHFSGISKGVNGHFSGRKIGYL